MISQSTSGPTRPSETEKIISFLDDASAVAIALKEQRIHSTLEFFPEEGKYHYNGHRNCNFSETPEQTLKRGLLCPICRRPLTIGVMHRVAQLAEKDRPEGFKSDNRPKFTKLVPLLEVIAEASKTPITNPRVRSK